MTNKSKNVNIRELVLDTLVEVLEKNCFSSTAIHGTLQNHSYLEKKDRSFITKLTNGVVERVIELDYIIEQFSSLSVKKMKPLIRNILRMGVYQIIYMEQIPDRAACNEAVKLTEKRKFIRLKGFVNGILRNVSRSVDQISYPDKEKEPEMYLSIRYSMPQWIVNKWLVDYDFEITENIIRSFLLDKKTTIRCNTNKISTKELGNLFMEKGIGVESGAYIADALNLSNYDSVMNLPGFEEGYFQVQDESSMLVVTCSGIKEGDKVVDVCAAPGGKSLHAAQQLNQTGVVSARDLSEHKVTLIRQNLKRLDFHNVETKVHDALALDEDWIGKADVVIADLPCSGLGVIGKKPDIKYNTSEKDIHSLQQLQRDILGIVAKYVAPKGVLMYSTCTINKEENEDNIKWFVEHFDFHTESLDPYLPEEIQGDTTQNGYLQLVPGIHKTDGFFVARLRSNQ